MRLFAVHKSLESRCFTSGPPGQFSVHRQSFRPPMGLMWTAKMDYAKSSFNHLLARAFTIEHDVLKGTPATVLSVQCIRMLCPSLVKQASLLLLLHAFKTVLQETIVTI